VHGLEVELNIIKTTGDKITDVPLAQVGGKGLFVKEIEEALTDGRVDLAVHSMKDVPTEFPEGLALRCITKREDPRDALISRDGKRLSELTEGAKVGTSSLRRRSQLLAKRPDLVITDLRGNLDTRLRKLDDGVYDAIILAGAGLNRLGWSERITELIDPDTMLPAIGQGALGIETRISDGATNELVAFFDDPNTSDAVKGERALLKKLEGGCQVPIAAYGTVKDMRLKLKGLVAAIDGSRIIESSVEGNSRDSVALGVELAEELLKMGAKEILDELYSKD
jgi:hydroxymethylbilane synthase